MEFDEALVKKCQFGLAVIIKWSTLSCNQEFLDSLSASEWLEIHNYAYNHGLGEKVLLKLAEQNKPFKWLLDASKCIGGGYTVRQSPDSNQMLDFLVGEMTNLAQSFDEWLIVYWKAKHDSPNRRLAFLKLTELAA